MKKIKINGTEFTVEKQNYKFLDDYITRLKSYIKKYDVDQDLYDDILIRLEEKLSQVKKNNKKKTITQKDCVAIINELGEPEDIFDIEENIAITQNSHTQLQEANTPQKPNKKYTFWIKVAIFAFWTILLFFVFALRAPAPVIIIIATMIILMARYSVNYDKASQLIKRDFGKIRNLILGIFSFLWSNTKQIIVYTWKFITRAGKNILTLARIFFFIGFGLMLLFGVLLIIIWLGAYFSNFSIENIDLFAFMPSSFPVGGIFGAISLALFGIFFINFGIKKKGIGNLRIITATISLFTGLFFAAMSGFSLFSTYFGQSREKFEDIQVLKLSDETANHISDKEKVYQIRVLPPNISKVFVLFDPRETKVKPSDDNTIKIVSEIIWFGPEEIKQKIKDNLITPTITQDHEIISIGYNTKKLFTNKTPFVPLKIYIKEIYIPKNIKFNTSFANTQLSLPINLEKYKSYISYNDCQENYYDEERKLFTCNISEETLAKLQLQNIIYPLTWKTISDLSPIKHQAENKRRYYNDRGKYDSDWNIKNIDREGDKLTIIYADQSLSITATAQIEEKNQIIDEGGNTSPFVIKNFKIQKIIKHSKIYKDTYYQNPEKISECENGC